jgi:hypothetical protein
VSEVASDPEAQGATEDALIRAAYPGGAASPLHVGYNGIDARPYLRALRARLRVRVLRVVSRHS